MPTFHSSRVGRGSLAATAAGFLAFAATNLFAQSPDPLSPASLPPPVTPAAYAQPPAALPAFPPPPAPPSEYLPVAPPVQSPVAPPASTPPTHAPDAPPTAFGQPVPAYTQPHPAPPKAVSPAAPPPAVFSPAAPPTYDVPVAPLGSAPPRPPCPPAGPAATPPAPPAPKFDFNWNSGLYFQTANKDFAMHLGGLVHTDAVWATAPASLQTFPGGTGRFTDGVTPRRLRLFADGTMYKHFDFLFAMEFANGTGPVGSTGPALATNTFGSPGVLDAWITVKDIPGLGNVRIGNQKE
ncbi:MAG TPA: hypothetical protein VMZ71_15555, partial [Gemmataceae bacterium]|nr:hypothetical protein [Gemmataceae bacterium]